jgi:polar amino acid transport system substrate-binding protein
VTDPHPNQISRRDLLRFSALGLAAVGGGSVLSACSTTEAGNPNAAASGLMQRVEDGQPIRMVIGNEPPYTKLLPNGEVTGAEPDVAKAVLKRMGITEVEPITAGYNAMIPGLDADRWDMVAAGLFMNQSRCADVLYSSPVIVSTESLAVPSGNPMGLSTLNDVQSNKDVKVAVLSGSFELKTSLSLGIPESQLPTYTLAPDAMQALDDGRVDAVLLPTLTLQDLKGKLKGFEISPPLDEFPTTGSGEAFRKSDKDFHAKYNKELEAFKQTPEFDKTLAKWGFSGDAARDATTKELCATEG